MSRSIGRAVAAVAIVVLSASVAPGIAGAADRGHHFGRGHEQGRWEHGHGPRLTAEQRQCLADQARTIRPGALRTPGARLAAWRAALEACGITFGHGPSSTTTTTTTTKPPPIEPN